MKKLLLLCLLALAGCAQVQYVPDSVSAPYQAKAAALIATYNAEHGTDIPVPAVVVHALPDLEFGHSYGCHLGRGCSVIVLAVEWSDTKHGAGYAMANILPHELGHHACNYLRTCAPGNDHGPGWVAAAVAFGLDPNDLEVLQSKHDYP